MTDLLELADRVEAAVEPDRAVDALIHEAVTTFSARIGGPGWPDGELVVPAFPGWIPLPRYTASLDAAITLVPKDFSFSLDLIGTECGAVLNRTPFARTAAVANRCNSPALALTAACLRALAAEAANTREMAP